MISEGLGGAVVENDVVTVVIYGAGVFFLLAITLTALQRRVRTYRRSRRRWRARQEKRRAM